MKPLLALPLLVAAALTVAGGDEQDSFLRTDLYELVLGADPDRWCGPGDDAYVGDEPADLIGAHFALSLSCLFREQSVPEHLAGEVPELEHLPAAEDGAEFLIVRIAHQAKYWPELEDSLYGTRSWIMVGERRIDVGEVPAAGKFLVLCVPIGAEAVLWVEDSGRAQGLDLRTGSRVDPIAGYYDGPIFRSFPGEEFTYEKVRFGTSRYWWDMSCTTDSSYVRRTMWTEELGWAPEGTAFLSVRFWWCGDGTFDETTWALDHGEALEVMIGTEPAEQVAWNEDPSTEEWGGAMHTVVFSVPVDQGEFKVLFTPIGQVTELADGSVYDLWGQPDATVWTVKF